MTVIGTDTFDLAERLVREGGLLGGRSAGAAVFKAPQPTEDVGGQSLGRGRQAGIGEGGNGDQPSSDYNPVTVSILL